VVATERRSSGTSGSTWRWALAVVLVAGIALARLPHRDPNSAANTCSVELRNKTVSVQIVSPKFVRHGKSLLDKAEVPG
jgi:hypothetical protein